MDEKAKELSHHFDQNFTNSAKGFALLLLLWHHLFYARSEFGTLVQNSAILAKVCVAIFIILSGFGFAESVRLKTQFAGSFIQKRLTSLYLNYWLIALVAVPIGILFFNRTFSNAFEDHGLVKFVIQMSGMHRFLFTEFGYNATWWYMSAIIPLIVLFPILYRSIQYYAPIVFLVLFAILIPGKPVIAVLNDWLLPFAVGIFISQKNLFHSWLMGFKGKHFIKLGMLLVVLAIVIVFRSKSPLLNGTKIDWLFGSLLLLLLVELFYYFPMIKKPFAFMGDHLFNIFLFHSFIYYYYFPEWIYSFENPTLIFLVLLSSSLFVSVILEQVKKYTGFYWLQDKLSKINLPWKGQTI